MDDARSRSRRARSVKFVLDSGPEPDVDVGESHLRLIPALHPRFTRDIEMPGKVFTWEPILMIHVAKHASKKKEFTIINLGSKKFN